MRLVADDVQSLVIPGVGHWLAEEAPEEMLAALTEFLARTGTDRQRRTIPARVLPGLVFCA